MEVILEGADKIMRMFDKIGKNFDSTLDKALQEAAKAMQGSIKEKTPVDTGNLRENIAVEKTGKHEFSIGTNVEYALFVEFGTGLKGDPRVEHTTKESWVYFDEKTQSFKTSHGQPPAHMFTDGFEETKDIVTDIISDKLLKEARK